MEFQTSDIVGYEDAVAFMESRAADIRAGKAGDCAWLLEHPPLYTAGTSAKNADLIEARFPVFKTGRGGEYTYHGPGQRIAYVMADLKPRGSDVRKYVCDLEEWIIAALAEFGVKGEQRKGRIGIWVQTGNTEKKIAAIGVRVRKWVAYHGVSINVNPDLSHYAGIVPCGISEFGVTSLHDLGVEVSMEEFDAVLKEKWDGVFARKISCAA